MARVSLILPVVRGGLPSASAIAPARDALEAAGHEVEIVVAAGPGIEGPAAEDAPAPDWRWEAVVDRGRTAAAIRGLESGAGDILLVLDPHHGYAPADVARVVEVLASGQAELAVASRWASAPGTDRVVPLKAGLGMLARLLIGSSDPLSGLVGLTRPALDRAGDHLRAVGSQFALELLTKVPGRRIDILARPQRDGPGPHTRPGFDDLRHLKHLADHRFGNVSRLAQFCLVGASGMVIDLSSYALFQWLFDRTRLAGMMLPVVGPLDLATAAVLAVALALTWNFSLNRRLTFSDARGGSIFKQFLAYTLSNALAVSVNLFLRLRLPQYFAFFDRHKLTAAVVGIVLATAISFSMSRWLVFRRKGPGPGGSRYTPRRSDSTLARDSLTP